MRSVKLFADEFYTFQCNAVIYQMLKGKKKRNSFVFFLAEIYFAGKHIKHLSALASAKGDYGYGDKDPISFKLVNNAKVQFMCYEGKEIT